MDSLPEQPIDSLQGATRKEAYERIARLCVALREGVNSEEELAKRAPFPSVEVMRISLKNWGLSALLPTGGEKTSLPDNAPKKKGKRKAKAFGEKTPLPAAERAINQFRRTLGLITKNLEQLRGRDEYLQSGRFGGKIDRDGKRLALGAWQTPPEPLTTLIAIEALVSGHARSPAITWLLGALHPSELIEVREETDRGTFTRREPDPEKVNIKQLDEAIQELRKRAGDVAALVRGREDVSPGAPPAPVSPRYLSVINLVRQRAREGASDEQILEEVNRRLDRGPFEIDEDLTLKDIRYLKSLPSKASPLEDGAQ